MITPIYDSVAKDFGVPRLPDITIEFKYERGTTPLPKRKRHKIARAQRRITDAITKATQAP